jgi:6-phosphogluconolactonase
MLLSRRGALALLVCLFGLAGQATPAEEAPKKFMVYIGTYTRGTTSQGIYRMELDLATGQLSEPKLAGKITNPSFLAIHPTGKYLYAVGEIDDFGKKRGGGAINAFALDQKTGDLTLLNQQSSKGGGPCHVVVDKAGKFVLAANYGGGSACVLPIEEGGKLGPVIGFGQHKGHSINKSRQEAPHAHSINLDAKNRFAFVADLGLDQVIIYRFDAGKLHYSGHAGVKPGAGPRHFAFHPDGKHAYVINELDSTITVFDYDADKGALTSIQTISTLPAGYKGQTTTAEVVVHPSGKFVYGSNRGHNSIAVFRVDATTGKLSAAGHQNKGIKIPRNFAIDPTGKYCVVANQDGDSVIVFTIDPKTGELGPTEAKAAISRPVCVRFLAWPR